MFNTLIFLDFLCREQPPSGGCVLKPYHASNQYWATRAAAFGRLCVETHETDHWQGIIGAAAFGRLCVETMHSVVMLNMSIAAAFGRLCVETFLVNFGCENPPRSRLRAAVC